ncbi:MAG: septal ring lytic transglycosylase RlpA family protein, partial [Xanthobacteraceae bacterium]
PYVVGGQVYVPEDNPHYQAVGLASWYGDDFHGRYTANGEIFDLNGVSAAHPTLPLPSYARVTNLANGHSLIVRVNDRGPYAGKRIIDVSVKAAHLLGFYNRGTTMVRVEYVGRAPMEGSDDRILEATLRQNEPAPPPSSVRLAATPIFPPAPPPPARNAVLASASANDALPDPPVSRAMSYADPPSGLDGTDQFLNGRGLY